MDANTCPILAGCSRRQCPFTWEEQSLPEGWKQRQAWRNSGEIEMLVAKGLVTPDSLGRNLDKRFVSGFFDMQLLGLQESTNIAKPLRIKAPDAFSLLKQSLSPTLDLYMGMSGCEASS